MQARGAAPRRRDSTIAARGSRPLISIKRLSGGLSEGESSAHDIARDGASNDDEARPWTQN
jgi:hypothetical protein